MEFLLQIPLSVRLLTLFLTGLFLGSWANLAIYSWAWRPRSISPWAIRPKDLPRRTWADCIPIIGWLRLRRESPTWGPWFWLRPILVEFTLGAGLALLYWWEVDQLRLIGAQHLLPGMPVNVLVPGLAVPSWVLHATYFSHAVLCVLMLIATMIDADDRIIPDEVTVPGTLLGLLLVAVLPMSLLPHVAERAIVPTVGVPADNAAGAQAIGPAGLPVYVEPATAAAPHAWPAVLFGLPSLPSLLVGVGCYWLWCFALAPRIWRGRRGWLFAAKLITARVIREFRRPPLSALAIGGPFVIAALWWWGGAAWIGMLSALISLATAGVFVWAVRIVCSSALRVEALGFGDVTLMMMIGAFLGWQACLVLFFIAPLAGLVIGIARLLLGLGNMLPYGPFLCLAAVVTIVSWAWVWNYLKDLAAVPHVIAIVLVGCLVLMWAMLTVWRWFKVLVFGREELL